MTHPLDETEEKPLDPAVERVRRRMMRMMLVSIGIMLVGLMAVLFGIVYKLNSGAGSTASGNAGFDALVELPPGGRVVSESLADGQIMLRVEDEEGRQGILLFDAATGRRTGRLTFTTP